MVNYESAKKEDVSGKSKIVFYQFSDNDGQVFMIRSGICGDHKTGLVIVKRNVATQRYILQVNLRSVVLSFLQ